jgi:serine/threonine-protein kinase
MDQPTCRRCGAANSEFNLECAACGATLDHDEEAEAPDHLAGQTIGRYRIGQVLGKGAMGVVYRATDVTIGRDVALKFLSRGDAGTRARLLREAQAAGALDHPNILTVHDIGEHDGRPFLAMALYDGETLASSIARGPLSIDDTRATIVQILSGLAAAHAAGVVHRDLKPANVIVTGEGRVKVVDFGLAKLQRADASLTEPGELVGTVAYMAPEQLRGGAADARTDLFATGVIAYEMLTGAWPFVGESSIVVGSQILTAEPRPVRSLRDGVPPALEAFVMRLLNKNPDARYASADAARRALLSGGANPAARPQRRRLTAGLALALLVIAVGTVLWQRHPRAAPTPPPTALAMIDGPAPKTSSPDAEAAYALAMQLFRDGSVNLAAISLNRALRFDSNFAAAHVHLAVLGLGTRLEQRNHFLSATRLRSSLGERDLALLQIAEARLLGDRPDFEEARKRARVAAERFPDDPYIAMLHGDALFDLGRATEAYAENERALRLDPKFAYALVSRAAMMERSGDVEGALAAADRCVAISPSAGTCLRMRADIFDRRGSCDALEADARRMVSIEPEGYAAYSYLAMALVARGAPPEAVAEARRKRTALIGHPFGTPLFRLRDDLYVAYGVGDFDTAIARAQAMNEAFGDEASEELHAFGTAILLDAYEETGDRARAARVADDYANRLGAWTPDAPGLARPLVLMTRRQAGSIGDAELRTTRDAWMTEERAQLPPDAVGRAWIDFFARTTRTANEAHEATDALPHDGLATFGPDNRLERDFDEVATERAVARVHLLSGEVDLAIQRLRGAIAMCSAPSHPEEYLRAHRDLGQALEVKDDRGGACAAYSVVTRRWARAKPRSLTLADAQARSRKLGCAP